ncbi:hypothetical protein EJ04DRAFT_361127 [Polyplosphaeria fusca]|uniref:Uncharacterized protein n=1 Tax=Polyplosphaeria fusca TaxID=682080 RepID=A0A9P4QQF2_9PLEO|nr:hypothetical protein EJ04DRAFT_361127 [Polyplosphaeria fusca]
MPEGKALGAGGDEECFAADGVFGSDTGRQSPTSSVAGGGRRAGDDSGRREQALPQATQGRWRARAAESPGGGEGVKGRERWAAGGHWNWCREADRLRNDGCPREAQEPPDSQPGCEGARQVARSVQRRDVSVAGGRRAATATWSAAGACGRCEEGAQRGGGVVEEVEVEEEEGEEEKDERRGWRRGEAAPVEVVMMGWVNRRGQVVTGLLGLLRASPELAARPAA